MITLKSTVTVTHRLRRKKERKKMPNLKVVVCEGCGQTYKMVVVPHDSPLAKAYCAIVQKKVGWHEVQSANGVSI